MKDLFYSTTEQFLFYVAGYTDSSVDVTDAVNVVDFVEMLIKGADKLANLIKTDRKNIYTFLVTKSDYYKGMRVFYVKTDVVPKSAHECNQTMIEYITKR